MHFAYMLNSIIILGIILVLLVKNTKDSAKSYAFGCNGMEF